MIDASRHLRVAPDVVTLSLSRRHRNAGDNVLADVRPFISANERACMPPALATSVRRLCDECAIWVMPRPTRFSVAFDREEAAANGWRRRP
jgi:hypothetical protein